MAEDDPDDRLLITDAFRELNMETAIRFVQDGEELLDYLKRRDRYAEPGAAPRPCIVLLDLNMPRKDGREALRELKSDPELRRIPVVVLTTSNAPEDIGEAYDLGVNSFIVKPAGFQTLVEIVQNFRAYWLNTVRLPEVVESSG